MKELDQLYTEVIRQHQSAPFNFQKRNDLQQVLKVYNPICGDKFEIFITNNKQFSHQDVSFYGFGCAISKASTSVMIKSLVGKSNKEALEMCNHFLGFLNNELNINNLILPEEFRAFAGVHQFPERLECAALAWREMKLYLEKRV